MPVPQVGAILATNPMRKDPRPPANSHEDDSTQVDLVVLVVFGADALSGVTGTGGSLPFRLGVVIAADVVVACRCRRASNPSA